MQEREIETYVGVGGIFSLNEDGALAGRREAVHAALGSGLLEWPHCWSATGLRGCEGWESRGAGDLSVRCECRSDGSGRALDRSGQAAAEKSTAEHGCRRVAHRHYITKCENARIVVKRWIVKKYSRRFPDCRL